MELGLAISTSHAKQRDLVSFLIENGADVNSIDNQGTTPLMLAASIGSCDGEDPEDAASSGGGEATATDGSREPLINEAPQGVHVWLAKTLIIHQALVCSTDPLGDTALHKAALYGTLWCVRHRQFSLQSHC